MSIKIQELNPKTGKVRHVFTFPSKNDLVVHLQISGLYLRETEIFGEACENGEIFVCGLKYHISLEKLIEEIDSDSGRAWKKAKSITLSGESFDKIQELISEPPAPSDKLKTLMNSKPRYQKL